MKKTNVLLIICVLLAMCVRYKSTAQNIGTLPVYADSTPTLWHPSGWMPGGEGVIVNPGFNAGDNVCLKIGFAPKTTTEGWVGIYWLPDSSWWGPGIDVYEYMKVDSAVPMKLTFRVRGENGGERVQFKVGGVTKGNDSIDFPVSTPYISLSADWETKEIDLSKKNLSNVVGGFCAVTNTAQNSKVDNIIFYLDDIKFEVIK